MLPGDAVPRLQDLQRELCRTRGQAKPDAHGLGQVVGAQAAGPLPGDDSRRAPAGDRQEWCGSRPEELVERGGAAAKGRLRRLFEFLSTGKLQVKVLPDRFFGLIHGKAGVITLANGAQTAFLGSVNESKPAWTLNYELLWEDRSAEAVAWVQAEFDALWTHHAAVPLAEFVVEDIERLSRREVIASVADWAGIDTNPKRQPGTDLAPLLALRVSVGSDQEDRKAPLPAAVLIETPVYRQQVGLWEHQKYFVKLAFDAQPAQSRRRTLRAGRSGRAGQDHPIGDGRRTDGLHGDQARAGPRAKTLLGQWQGELRELLDMPSALWNGRQWVDENGLEYPVWGAEGIKKCPRRVGLVSTGLITAGSEAADYLKSLSFECVIVDKARPRPGGRIWARAATARSPTPTTSCGSCTRFRRRPRACCWRRRPQSSCGRWRRGTCSTRWAGAVRRFWVVPGAPGGGPIRPCRWSWARSNRRPTTWICGNGCERPCRPGPSTVISTSSAVRWGCPTSRSRPPAATGNG